MRRCHSCTVEPGEYHMPACESRDRDVAGRFVLGLQWGSPALSQLIVDMEASLAREFVTDMEEALHGGRDDEGDER